MPDMNTPKFIFIILCMIRSVDNASVAVRTNKGPTNSSTYITDAATEASNGTNYNYFSVHKKADFDSYSFMDHAFKTLVCPEYYDVSNGAYVEYPNGSVYIPELSRLYNTSDYDKISPFIIVCKPGSENKFDNYTISDLEDYISKSLSEFNFLVCEEYHYVGSKSYETYPNKSVYVPELRRLFKATDYMKVYSLIAVCNANIKRPKLFEDLTLPPWTMAPEKYTSNPSPLHPVMLIGSLICLFCFMIHNYRYCPCTKFKSPHGYCTFNICKAFLWQYSYETAENFSKFCEVLQPLTMYFTLASFFWLNAMTYEIWLSLRMVVQLQRQTVEHTRPYKYFAYAWIAPAIPIAVCLIINLNQAPISFRLLYEDETCRFRDSLDTVLYFMVPIALLSVVNAGLLTSSFILLKTHSLRILENREDLRYRFKITVGIVVLMTGAGGSVVLLMLTEWKFPVYTYILLTALQGLLILYSRDKSLRCRGSLRGLKTLCTQSTSTENLTSS